MPATSKPKIYNPRHPERTLLHQAVAENYETWLDLASAGQFDGQGDQHAGHRCGKGATTRRWAREPTLSQIEMTQPNRPRTLRSISASVGKGWQQRFCQRCGEWLCLAPPKTGHSGQSRPISGNWPGAIIPADPMCRLVIPQTFVIPVLMRLDFLSVQRHQRWPNGLQMATRQPPWCYIINISHRFIYKDQR